jgi:hypothetical protein
LGDDFPFGATLGKLKVIIPTAPSWALMMPAALIWF